jgi:transposase
MRHRYKARPVWMLLDEGKAHTAQKSQDLAASLNIEPIWLPKQAPELNSMDQLWKELKNNVSANYQFSSIDEHADYAEEWLMTLSPREALRKAGVLSKSFWLKSFLQ